MSKMKSGLRKTLKMMGRSVTAASRAGSVPEPLKIWCFAFSGMAKMALGPHSNEYRRPSGRSMTVEPRPEMTWISSSCMCCSGLSSPPGGISTTYAER